jgi:hypothetical protein
LALAADANDYNKCFILTADVNLQGQVFTTALIAADTSSSGGFQGTAFTGTFDGNGHKITHFTINGIGNDYAGLFGNVGTTGKVENVFLVDVNVTGCLNVGGLVGNNGGSISNCHSTGTIGGYDAVGNLVGKNDGSISNCNSTGTVDGVGEIGGLVGVNCSSVSNCYSTGPVSGSSSSSYSIGGLVGYNYGGSVSNCYSTGAVSDSPDSLHIGGLVGYNDGSISNCYSTGTVSGSYDSYWVGGLVGYNCSSISNCYSTGAVSGWFVLGLVGANDGSIVSSFWDTETSGQSMSNGGTGKTTAEMKTLSTFTSAGWDFVEIWGIGENQTYPYLRTEPAGDLNHDKKVDFEDFAIFAENWLK